MLRRSRLFRHLFLDVAAHPNLIFRSFTRTLESSRVELTGGTQAVAAAPSPAASRRPRIAGDPTYAIPTEYTVFLSATDFTALTAAEDAVRDDLIQQYRQFLLSPAGRPYNSPHNQNVSFRFAIDTELGLEPNEYYFAWPREILAGLVGRLDLYVRGERVETADVPEAAPLGIGATQSEHVRLDRIADADAFLPPGASLWIVHEAGRPTLLNRSHPSVPILVDGAALESHRSQVLRDGARIAVGPEICLVFTREAAGRDPKTAPPAVEARIHGTVQAPSPLMGEDGGGRAAGGLQSLHAPTAPTSGEDALRPPTRRSAGLARLEVIGSVLTTQMFDHAPDGILGLGTSSRCHIPLMGQGLRPVHAELLRGDGGLYLRNCSGRRSVFVGTLQTPVRPGARHPLALGEVIRLGELLLHLAPPSPIVNDRVARYFGTNYLGNLIFQEPQAQLVVDERDPRPIDIGRDDAWAWRSGSTRRRVSPRGAGTGDAPLEREHSRALSLSANALVRTWRLASPYLWPNHARLVFFDGPTIQPHRDALRPLGTARSILFVNFRTVLLDGDAHVLVPGDLLVLGNLLIRYDA
jgi:hypothetical protein